ncbi:MAG: protein kinase [Sandaracinaceae bacterium]|nr:protein kinase [Sandaracinaceae bacterium]
METLRAEAQSATPTISGEVAIRAFSSMEDLPKICPRCSARFAANASYCPRDGAMLITPHDVDPYLGQTLLGQFHIQEKIGAGGMGTVYRAHQAAVDRDVAIKILHRELAQNPDAVRRFHREAKVSAALDHPHVVRVILFGQLPDGNLYLVMEYLKGASLSDVLAREGRLTVQRAMHIMLQVCEGIGEAHSQGVIHRDVKPENIILVPRAKDPDFVKVLDFGIARFVTGDQTVVTQTGLIFGTARYISPEGAAGEPTDARSDVYSLAVMAYHLMCGESPFDAPSSVTLLMKHMHEPAPDIRSRKDGAHVPSAIADVIARALAKNPDARYANAHVFGDALAAAVAKSGLVMPAVRRPSSMSLVPSADAPSTGVTASEKKTAPVVDPAVQGSLTLAGAPNPFDDSTGRVVLDQLPGVGRSRAVWKILLGFVFGAAIVFGVYVFASRNDASDEVSALYERAHTAFDQQHYDAPDRENVDDLTQAILALDSAHEGAKHLRADVALRLRADAEHKRVMRQYTEARAAYQRALIFAPRDAVITAALASMDNAQRLRLPVGVRTAPVSPTAGQPATLLAIVDSGTRFAGGAELHFNVSQNGRSVRGEVASSAEQVGRQFVGTFTFPRAGTYDLLFTARSAEGTFELRGQTVVLGPASAQRPPSSPDRRPADAVDPPVVSHDFRTDPDPGPVDTPPANDTNINWDTPPRAPATPIDVLAPHAPAQPEPSTNTPPPWNG